jgi:hypothetical protein
MEPVKGELCIVDVVGTIVMRAARFPIDCTKLPKGMYFLTMNNQTIAFQKR